MTVSLPLVLGVLTPFLFILVTKLKYRNSPPLPPGPRGWPILGSFFEMPESFEWLHWSKFKSLYGEYIIRHSIVYHQTDILITTRACELRDCARQAGYPTELAEELRRYLREKIICIFRTT